MRRSRRRQPPPDLTSLFDVLFIVIFAALIRAAAAESAAAHAATPPQPPQPPVKLEVAQLQSRAVAQVDKDLSTRPTVIVRVSAAGSITEIETSSKTEALDSPLLEHSPDPDVALSYLGDRAAELRLCRIAAVHLNMPDLAHYLVIIAPAAHLEDLPHALYEGLRRDVDRCIAEQKGLAVIVDPSVSDVNKPASTPSSPMVKP